jgi:hypothetical protein
MRGEDATDKQLRDDLMVRGLGGWGFGGFGGGWGGVERRRHHLQAAEGQPRGGASAWGLRGLPRGFWACLGDLGLGAFGPASEVWGLAWGLGLWDRPWLGDLGLGAQNPNGFTRRGFGVGVLPARLQFRPRVDECVELNVIPQTVTLLTTDRPLPPDRSAPNRPCSSRGGSPG